MTAKPQIMPRDLMLFYYLARFRVLDSEQLDHLLTLAEYPLRDVQKRRRLKQLFEWQYIDLPKFQKDLWIPVEKDAQGNTIKGTGGSTKNLYALGQKGADALLDAIAQDHFRLPLPARRLGGKWTEKNRKIREDTLRHLLLINKFFVALTRAYAGTGVTIDWRSEWEWPPALEERRETGDAVYLDVTRPNVETKLYPSDAPRNLKGQRLPHAIFIPIRPDGFFTLSWKGRGGQAERLAYFLEADRGKEPTAGRTRDLRRRSLYKKYVGYWNWMTHERGHKAFGLDGFAVLTVTTSTERASNFAKAATAAVSRRPPSGPLFWSTAETDFLATAEDPLRFRRLASPIWISEKGEPGSHHPFEHLPL